MKRRSKRQADSQSDLYRRIETYGSRGIVEVESPEGASVDPDAVQFLAPPT